MDEKEIKKSISEVITSSLRTNQFKSNNKLEQMQQFYQVKRLGFIDTISDDNRLLTKKIFGTGIRCLRKNEQPNQSPSSTNLICLGYILLDIAFKDQYVLRLIIEELHKSTENIAKMLQAYNPYKTLGINAELLQNVLVEIIVKINNWRTTFSMSDILRDYYFASHMYSIFLRVILYKVGYKQAQNLRKYLDNTQQIYEILCDYFDLNVIAHRANSLRKHSQLSPNIPKSPKNPHLTQRAQVYLFSNYNLFISTCDNVEFCCGRFYSNQTELLNCQKEIRKSTLEYILKCKEGQEGKDGEDGQGEDGEDQGKFGELGLEQMEIDLGLSSSGLVFSCQQQTPYFNSSNPETPQFGGLLDSARFRKSIDFQTALNLANRPKDKQLGIVQEQMNSPCSEGDKKQFMRESNLKMFCPNGNGLEESLNFQNQEAPKIKIFLKNKNNLKKEDDEDYCNKPRSPPSIQSSHKKQPQHSLKHWQNSRQLTFHKNLQSQNMSIQDLEPSPNKISILDHNPNFNPNPNLNPHLFPHQEQHRLNIPVIGKKSLLENNSDLRSQSKLEYNDYQREYKEFVNMSVKESQHFIKMEENQGLMTVGKRRDLNARKYSVNQTFNNQLKELKKREKDVVHHSNHFTRPEPQQQPPKKPQKSPQKPPKQSNTVWQNTHSDNLALTKSNPRKMGFISNIVNVQLTSAQKDKKQILYGVGVKEGFKPIVTKFSMEELRKSKGKGKGTREKSPRIRKELYSTIGLSGRVLDCQGNFCFRGLNASRNDKVRAPKESNNCNQKIGDLVSTIIIKEDKLKNSSKRSPRQAKPSKFPQFLRNSKSRKGLAQNVQQAKPTNLVQNEDITIQVKDPRFQKPKLLQTQSQSQPQTQPYPYPSSFSHPNPFPPSPHPYSQNPLQTSQQKLPKYPFMNPPNPTPTPTLTPQLPKSQQQLYQHNQQQFQIKSKHTRSQPLLPNVPEMPNKNLVIYDSGSKPWQYFGSSTSIQTEISPKYGHQGRANQGNYVSRQSFSSNQVGQKVRSPYEQPFKHITSQQYLPNLNQKPQPQPQSDRYQNIANTRNISQYPKIYQTQPQPLVFNEQALQRTASFSTRPQVYQPTMQATYSNYSNNGKNNGNFTPLELYYSSKATYSRHTANLNNINNFNTSSSMNLTPNPLSPTNYFQFNQSPSPPATGQSNQSNQLYPTTPTRQKIQTASSSKVFSTKAESPTYLSMQNQFSTRFQQLKYALKEESKK